MATPHWAIPTMAGTDAAATIDNTFDSAMTALDDHGKVIFDTFANRGTPAARKSGMFFVPTDMPGYCYLSDGANWIEISPGMGSIPIGSSLDWWTTNDPGDTRFVKMDGRALSTTTYATLYTLLGNSWDTFDGQSAPGAGLFRVPRSYGRTHVSSGQGNGLTNRVIGSAVGEESHILTIPEMPRHDHSDPDRSWVDIIAGTGAGAYSNPAPSNGGPGGAYAPYLYIQPQGGGLAHNNVQPSLICNRIIRIA